MTEAKKEKTKKREAKKLEKQKEDEKLWFSAIESGLSVLRTDLRSEMDPAYVAPVSESTGKRSGWAQETCKRVFTYNSALPQPDSVRDVSRHLKKETFQRKLYAEIQKFNSTPG